MPAPPSPREDAHQRQIQAWHCALRDRICQRLEALEQAFCDEGPPASFSFKTWARPDKSAAHGGGGEMGQLRGAVFEKAGVNISTVHGTLSEAFAGEVQGAQESQGVFWANGLSLVLHPKNPFVPAVHFNTRMIQTSKTWFGGACDLNPVLPFEEDVREFHQALQGACDDFNPAAYEDYKDRCDRYFYIPHRRKPRGAGGIFFDDLAQDWAQDFSFIQACAEAFLNVYPTLVERRHRTPYTAADRQAQLEWRGHYAEFNLVYDRGTRFGLMTGGSAEAVLMSLPPVAVWP